MSCNFYREVNLNKLKMVRGRLFNTTPIVSWAQRLFGLLRLSREDDYYLNVESNRFLVIHAIRG